MINKLTNDLDALQQSQDNQNKLLDQLYLTLQTINERKNYLYQPYTPNINLFNYVRPEVMHQILGFIDFHSFLMFRLINRQCNQISILLLKFKANDLQNHVNISELELENLIHKLRVVGQDSLTLICQQIEYAKHQIYQLTLASVCEFKSYCSPPQICLQIAFFLVALLDPFFNEKKSNSWQLAKKFLNSNIVEKLLSIDFESITESQLAKLSTIDQIAQEQVAIVSHAGACILGFIKIAVEIRRSEFYIIKHQSYKLKQKITKQKSLMQIIQKIVDQQIMY